jgi:hypothetical protein
MNKIFYKHYVFLDQINKIVEENLLKLRHLIIIVNINPKKDKNSWLQAQGEKSFNYLFFKINRRAAIVICGFFLTFFLPIFFLESFHRTPSNFTDQELQAIETEMCKKSEVLGATYSVKKICENHELKSKVKEIYSFLNNEETKLEIKTDSLAKNLDRRSLHLEKKNFGEALLNCASDECIASMLSSFDCEIRLTNESPSADFFSAEELCRAKVR